MILVDTSAWIEFFRGRDPIASAVDETLVNNEAALCGPVEAELRRGLLNERERGKVLGLLEACHVLGQPPELWTEAGDLGFALRRRGVAPKTIDLLSGESPSWRRLTHAGALVPDALPTYVVEEPLPEDLANRSHFFWTSGSLFRRAIDRWPALAERWHGCGPGHTRAVVEDTLGSRDRLGVWLDWKSWYQDVLV